MTKKYIQASNTIVEDCCTYTRDELVAVIDRAVDEAPIGALKVKFEVVRHEEWYPYQENATVSARLNITYQRLENDEEYTKRTANEKLWKEAQEKRDREDFERLSKKFKS